MAAAAAVLVLAAVVFTWPLAINLSRAIPAGGGPPTVALFGLFSMEWTGQALGEGRSYWDAPIFHPHRGTFAWSETQPLTALVVSMLARGTGAIAAYNLVLWLYLAAFGLAGYLLARQLTTDRTAALWASLWLTGGAYSIQQLGVLHLLAGAFPVTCLALLLFLARDFRRWVAWAAGLAYLLTFLTCAQFGLFLTLLLPFAAVPAIAAGRRSPWARAAACLGPLAAALLLALPWLLEQRAYLEEMGFERSLVNVRGALLPADLVLPAKGHWLAGRILGWSDAADAYPWDLGLVPIACLGAAAALGGLRKRGMDPVERRQTRALLLLSAAALLLGFGPNLKIPLGGETIVPYAWLHAVVPGLSGVRTPSRFGMFAIAGIAALSAAALAFLRQRTAARGPRRALTAVAFALLAAEMWAVPIVLADPRQGVDDHREVLRWLAEHGRGQPVVDLPMSAGDSEADLEREARAMLRALRHRSPVVNGYSGYFPEPFRQLRWALHEDPVGRGRRFLAALGVRYALVHHHQDLSAEREGWLKPLQSEVVFHHGSDTVLGLPPAPAVRPLPPPSSTARISTRPRSGDILDLPVAAEADHARFFAAPSGHRLRVLWTDDLGIPQTTEVRLGGSVLVDAGGLSVYVLLQRFPAGSGLGKGVLLSEEQVVRGRRVSP
jgi:hypothetical protein